MSGQGCWHKVERTLLTLDEDQIRTRANTAAAQLGDTVLLLIRSGDQPVREYLYGRTDRLTQAGNLAGFTVTGIGDDYPELPDDITASQHAIVPWRARLNTVSNMEKLRERSQEVRKSVEALMPADSYVSVSLRKRGPFEQARIRDWVADEGNTVEDENEYVRANTMCARITAGAADPAQARGLAASIGQAVSMLSDMGEHPSLPRFGLLAASIATTAATTVSTLLSPLDWKALIVPLIMLAGVLIAYLVGRIVRVQLPDWWLLFPLGALLAILPAIRWTIPMWAPLIPAATIIPATVRWTRRDLYDDIMHTPYSRFAFKMKRFATTADKETRMGDLDQRNRVTDYPLHRSTLIMPPLTVASLYAPVGDAAALQQDLHPVPETLAHDGVMLGIDQTGRTGYIDPGQLYKGVAIVGEQGSGKSVLTYGFMQWALNHRQDTPRTVWGADSTVIDFAMKDDHALAAMARYHGRHGHPASRTVTYLADPRYKTLDLCGLKDGKDAYQTATGIAAALQYSFDDGDIRNDSLDIITTAMTIAVAATRYEQARLRYEGDKPPIPLTDRIHNLASDRQCYGADRAQPQQSPIGWALMALCGSDGQTGSARALGKTMRALALEQPDNPDYVEASRAAEQLYGRPDPQGHNPVTDQRLLDKTNASRNKIRQFMPCEHVFTPGRGTLTWEGILSRPGEYHIVLAPHDGYRLPERMDTILGAWMMYRLWNTMTGMCQGWQQEGRHVMLVCDELSMLANSDDQILCHLHEQGRSFGLILVFATQYVKQFTPELLRSFTGYGTFISFNTSDPEIAQLTADRLSDSDGADGWTKGSVVNLPAHWAAVRTRTERQTQPSFLVHVHNFEDDPV